LSQRDRANQLDSKETNEKIPDHGTPFPFPLYDNEISQVELIMQIPIGRGISRDCQRAVPLGTYHSDPFAKRALFSLASTTSRCLCSWDESDIWNYSLKSDHHGFSRDESV